jgi:hypothetical protein
MHNSTRGTSRTVAVSVLCAAPSLIALAPNGRRPPLPKESMHAVGYLEERRFCRTHLPWSIRWLPSSRLIWASSTQFLLVRQFDQNRTLRAWATEPELVKKPKGATKKRTLTSSRHHSRPSSEACGVFAAMKVLETNHAPPSASASFNCARAQRKSDAHPPPPTGKPFAPCQGPSLTPFCQVTGPP